MAASDARLEVIGMATCPRCKGHLTDSHRCPRHPLIVGAELTLAGVAGGVVGLVVAALTVPQGRLVIDLTAMLVGALAGMGIDRYFRGPLLSLTRGRGKALQDADTTPRDADLRGSDG